MKISRLNNYNPNFGEKYKAEDVLRLATGYAYKGTGGEKLIKEITGVDMYSKEVKEQIPKEAEFPYVMIAIENICEKKVLCQNEKLQEAHDKFTEVFKTARDEQIKRSAFEELLKQFGRKIELKPFTITREEVEQAYREWVDLLHYALDLMYKYEMESLKKLSDEN